MAACKFISVGPVDRAVKQPLVTLPPSFANGCQFKSLWGIKRVCMLVTMILLLCWQGVTYSKQDAQDAVLKLMQGNVVLVGHALHHDLHALQLDPIAVIDTSLICTYK